ncbi:MAG: hypothetical protein ACRC30_09620 [Clostridium sp.]
MNKIEIPYDKNKLKLLIYSFLLLAIIILVFDFYYTFIYKNSNFYFSIFLFLIFLTCIYFSLQGIVLVTKNIPSIVFDTNIISIYSILGNYSININILAGYKFVEFNGINFINIYPKNYHEFKKQLGHNIGIRFIFFIAKCSGFEGFMISFFELSTNYNNVLNYLDKTFNN